MDELPEEEEDYGYCATKSEQYAAIRSLLRKKRMDAEDRARVMLNVYYGRGIWIHGGYPPDMTWDFFPTHVVVADLDDSKDRARTLLRIYDKAKLCKLAAVAVAQGYADEDGDRLTGADRLDAVIEFFEEHIDECECAQ